MVARLHKALRATIEELDEPEDVTFEILTLLRKPDLQEVARFLTPKAAEVPPAARVAGRVVQEQGTLSGCATCCYATAMTLVNA